MKNHIRGRDQFTKYKNVLYGLASIYRILPLKTRITLLERHRYSRGKLGCGIRFALLKSIAKKCGDNVFIGTGVFLLNAQNLILGSNISIHPMCYIECGPAPENYIEIDDDVSIAHGTTIMATSHTYTDETTDTIRDMEAISKPVHIFPNVWIGAKATILLGTTIQSGCVIGAHALVNKSTESDGIYVGVPAIRIKDRKQSKQK